MKKDLTEKQIFARLTRMDYSLFELRRASRSVCSSEIHDLIDSAWLAVYRCCKAIQNA